MSSGIEKYGHVVYSDASRPPWMGLGEYIQDMSTMPAILDFIIEKHAVSIGGVPAPDWVGLVRNTDGRQMGIAGSSYVPHQPHELWSIFQQFIDAGQMIVRTAGLLFGGKRIWIQAEIPGQSFKSHGGQDCKLLALLFSSFDLSLGSGAMPTGQEVVCNNTFNLAMRLAKSLGTAKYSQRHTSALRVEDAKSFVADSILAFSDHKENAQRLMATPCTPLTLTAFVADVIQPEINRYTGLTIDQIIGSSKGEHEFVTAFAKDASRTSKKLLEVMPRQLGGNDGSMWSAVNGVTYWCDHERGRSVDTRIASAWFGASNETKQRAMQVALNYADRLTA